MDFLTLFLTFLTCKEWFVVLSVSKALPRLNNRPLLIQLCWWFLILLILHCLITACFGLPVLWLILASFEPRKSWSLVPTASRIRTMTLQDLALDSSSSPETLHVQIKASKTGPFRKGTSIHIGLGKYPLCAIRAVVSYLTVRGDGPSPLFQLQSVSLCQLFSVILKSIQSLTCWQKE